MVQLNDLMLTISSEIETAHFVTNNTRFKFELPLVCNVVGNYNLLYAMFINLIRNADLHSHGTECGLRFMGEEDDRYIFSFYDNGTGIEEEHLQHLFERFYRVDKSHSKTIGGTGLGLSIVKHAAIYHNAEIKVKSELDKGTSITVMFNK